MISDTVLRRAIGGAAVLREQLEHLAEKTRDVGIYRLAFGQIRSAAVGPDETAAAITATARELGP